MTEPRTAAGRALLADVPHRPWRRDAILDAILAIEAEAASTAFLTLPQQLYRAWWNSRWMTLGVGEDSPPDWSKLSRAERRAWEAAARDVLAATEEKL
jgi:hypothetical protein